MTQRLRAAWRTCAAEDRARRAGLALFVLATAVRLAFNLGIHPIGAFVTSDMWVHNHRAENLLSGKLGPWDSFTPVGYPAMLAAVFALTGKSYAAVGVLQALLGGALAPLTHFIAHRVTRRAGVALASGLVVALYLPLVFYGGLLMTEVPFAFFFLLGLAPLVALITRPDLGASTARGRLVISLALAGLSLGVAALVRPNLLLVFPFFALVALFGGLPRRRALVALTIVTLGALPPIAAGSVHASRLVGRPTGIATNGGLNFYLAHAPVRGAHFKEGTFVHKIVPIPNMERYQQVYDSKVPLYDDKFFYALGAQTLAGDPRRAFDAFANVMEGVGLGRIEYWPGWQPVGYALVICSRLAFWLLVLPAALHVAALALLRRARAEPERGRLLLAAVIASAFATFYLFLGDPRMRVPFDPLFIVLALDGASRLARAVPTLRGLTDDGALEKKTPALEEEPPAPAGETEQPA